MSSVTTTPVSIPQTGPRLLIGGVMLAVMAAWVHASHEPPPNVLVIALAIAAGLGFVAGIAGLRADRTKAGLGALVGIVFCVVAGVGAVWLAFEYGRESLGQSLGLGLFAFLAVAAIIDERSAGLSSDEIWGKAVSRRAPIGLTLAALGAVSLGTFFYLGFIVKVGAVYMPEQIGLVLSGFLLLFGGVYLLTTKDPPPSVGGIRLFAIILGALLGVLLVFVSLIRALLWKDEILRLGAGQPTWQFWLAAYMFLGGIALIFASLNLTVEESESGTSVRRASRGYGSAIAGVLLLFLLLFVNLFASWKVPYTFNWSKSGGITALNPASKQLLTGLTEPTNVYVLMSPSGPVFNEVRNFLGNCQADTDKLTVTYIDPDTDFAKYQKLAMRFKDIVAGIRSPLDEEGGRGVLLVYGPIPEDVKQSVPHVFIPERKLFEVDQKGGRGKESLVLKVESETIRELAFLAKKSERRKIYILQGDGALDMNANEVASRQNLTSDIAALGAAKLVDKLKKDNYDVRGISFAPAPKTPPKDIDYLGSFSGDKKIEIPADCDTLILPGPTSPIPQAGLDALERYMDGNSGKLIVAVEAVADPQSRTLTKSGLEPLLKKYGVDVTNQILYRKPLPQERAFFGRANEDYRLVLALAAPKSPTVLAKQFQGAMIQWWSARVVKPGTSAKYQVDPLLQVQTRQSAVWADENLSGYADFERYLTDLIRSRRIEDLYAPPEPITVAVTVSERTGDTTRPRMVVFGDAEFLDNEDIGAFPANYDLVASSIEWMAEHSFVGPRPKEQPRYTFGPEANLERMIYGSFWTMLVVILVLGLGVWLVRRK